jgi:hypothetical protein
MAQNLPFRSQGPVSVRECDRAVRVMQGRFVAWRRGSAARLRGRFCQSAISSSRRSVLFEIVSRLISVEATSIKWASTSPVVTPLAVSDWPTSRLCCFVRWCCHRNIMVCLYLPFWPSHSAQRFRRDQFHPLSDDPHEMGASDRHFGDAIHVLLPARYGTGGRDQNAGYGRCQGFAAGTF